MPHSSFARLFLRIYPSQPSLCPSSYIYHWVVSINRPSGYEPDALPLRHNDGLSLDGFDPSPLGSLVCDHTLQTGGFDPPPLIPPVCVHYTTMTRFDICPIRLLQDFSFAYIRHRLHCVHLPIYHRVVSINRPMSPTRSKAQQAGVLCATMTTLPFELFSIAYRLVANFPFFFAPWRQWFEPSSFLILSTLFLTIKLKALLTHRTHYTETKL